MGLNYYNIYINPRSVEMKTTVKRSNNHATNCTVRFQHMFTILLPIVPSKHAKFHVLRTDNDDVDTLRTFAVAAIAYIDLSPALNFVTAGRYRDVNGTRSVLRPLLAVHVPLVDRRARWVFVRARELDC